MNTGHTLYPSYAMPPSPQSRQAADDLTLIALHTAIRFSGLFAKFTAQWWRLTHLAEAAEQVAKELIARAVETTGNPDPHPRYSDLGELHVIGIRVSVKDGGLLIEVWDSDPTPPQDAYLDSHLSTVEEISHQWDCYQPRSGGKVIRPNSPCLGNARPTNSSPSARRAITPIPNLTHRLRSCAIHSSCRTYSTDSADLTPTGNTVVDSFDESLRALIARGFRFQHLKDANGHVVILIRSYGWPDYYDRLHVHGENEAIAARALMDSGPGADEVVWSYQGDPVNTISELLELPKPHESNAPRLAHRAPFGLWLSGTGQTPFDPGIIGS